MEARRCLNAPPTERAETSELNKDSSPRRPHMLTYMHMHIYRSKYLPIYLYVHTTHAHIYIYVHTHTLVKWTWLGSYGFGPTTRKPRRHEAVLRQLPGSEPRRNFCGGMVAPQMTCTDYISSINYVKYTDCVQLCYT